jgi:prepilin-type N-terminal cleavage/methylation domain-containing protein
MIFMCNNRFQYSGFTRKGFSLVELLLIVAILAVIAAVGAPTVWQNMGARGDAKTVQGLASDIEYVRGMALMDIPRFAGVKLTANQKKYEVATRTKELIGEYYPTQDHSFSFDEYGKPVPPTDITIDIKRKSGAKMGFVTVSKVGLIKWGATP